MSVLGGSINELDVEYFSLPSLGAGEESLAEDNGALATAGDATLDETKSSLTWP